MQQRPPPTFVANSPGPGPGPVGVGGVGPYPPPMPPGGQIGPGQFRPGPPQPGGPPPPPPPPPPPSSASSTSSSSRRGGGGGSGGGGASSQQQQQQHRQSSSSAAGPYMQPGGGGGGPYPPPRPPPPPHQQHQQQPGMPMLSAKRKRRHADRLLSERIQQLVPESSSYMELLKLEKKLDQVILRKKLAIQEAQKKPQKLRRKLRILISNQFNPGTEPSAEPGGPEPVVPNWEVRVEGRLVDEGGAGEAAKAKRKFSSYFKSLVIELDKTLYGPDNHLVEWHRSPNTQETDGFQVKRPGDKPVKCTVLLMLDQQPPQFRLQPQLSRLLGIQCGTKAQILLAFWHYVKTKRLQDPLERSYIICDTGMAEAFRLDPQQQPPPRLRFADVPQRLHQLLLPPDPIVINHLISNEPGAKKTACYEIEVEVDDPYKHMAHNFLVNTSGAQELAAIDAKIFDTIEQINQMAQHRDFFNQFTEDPRQFITNWLVSQKQDLKTMTDLVGNPEEERRADFYQDSWLHEAATRYFSGKVTQRRQELEHALGIH